ncbi:hypothetical protein TELCIR_11486, partial [Teladorsagia circumcincta]
MLTHSTLGLKELVFQEATLPGYRKVSSTSCAGLSTASHDSSKTELAFLKDQKGVQYIHGSSIKFHGSLFLSNCVVDANWVVKLTDFGLQEIIWDKMLHKELACFQGVDLDHLPNKYLQLPPEMLRNVLAEGLLNCGSAKTDIYQLGMIIYQILFHTRPFSENYNLTTK